MTDPARLDLGDYAVSPIPEIIPTLKDPFRRQLRTGNLHRTAKAEFMESQNVGLPAVDQPAAIPPQPRLLEELKLDADNLDKVKFLKQALLHVFFSELAYYDPPHKITASSCGAINMTSLESTGFSLVAAHFDESSHTSAQFYAKAHYLIVVFRGTSSLKNVKVDLRSTPMEFSLAGIPQGLPSPEDSCARVHSGFYQSFLRLEHDIVDVVTKYVRQHPDPVQIYCTGHSLGGALAVLAALKLRCVLPGCKIVSNTFGAPRVGNHAFAQIYNRLVPESFRIVNNRDVVAGMPKGGEFKHAGRRIVITRSGRCITDASHNKAKTSASDHALGNYQKALVECLKKCGVGGTFLAMPSAAHQLSLSKMERLENRRMVHAELATVNGKRRALFLTDHVLIVDHKSTFASRTLYQPHAYRLEFCEVRTEVDKHPRLAGLASDDKRSSRKDSAVLSREFEVRSFDGGVETNIVVVTSEGSALVWLDVLQEYIWKAKTGRGAEPPAESTEGERQLVDSVEFLLRRSAANGSLLHSGGGSAGDVSLVVEADSAATDTDASDALRHSSGRYRGLGLLESDSDYLDADPSAEDASFLDLSESGSSDLAASSSVPFLSGSSESRISSYGPDDLERPPDLTGVRSRLLRDLSPSDSEESTSAGLSCLSISQHAEPAPGRHTGTAVPVGRSRSSRVSSGAERPVIDLPRSLSEPPPVAPENFTEPRLSQSSVAEDVFAESLLSQPAVAQAVAAEPQLSQSAGPPVATPEPKPADTASSEASLDADLLSYRPISVFSSLTSLGTAPVRGLAFAQTNS
eukprot:TRINITY_DN18590_c0_g1_i1.p1 TRINITY_DN18590_c0_g1~~TRINITY_DN18590_c0_g1_i1.p1  ORF type:complete len:803 (+),score=209.86 TRINITY_DN18590_c0_g1_i1:81-2489(+)